MAVETEVDEIRWQAGQKIAANIRTVVTWANRNGAGLSERDLLARFPELTHPSLTSDMVIRAILAISELPEEELLGASRRYTVVMWRHIGMYVVRRHLGYSYPKTAAAFGRKDHTTAMNACLKAEQRIESDPEFRRAYGAVMAGTSSFAA